MKAIDRSGMRGNVAASPSEATEQPRRTSPTSIPSPGHGAPRLRGRQEFQDLARLGARSAETRSLDLSSKFSQNVRSQSCPPKLEGDPPFGQYASGDNVQESLVFREFESFANASKLNGQEIKYSKKDIVAIGATSRAEAKSTGLDEETDKPHVKYVFLEAGNKRAGLDHVVDRHLSEFETIGTSEDALADLLVKARISGQRVAKQGKGSHQRPVYELSHDGAQRRIAISTGSNGFIVGANVASVPKK